MRNISKFLFVLMITVAVFSAVRDAYAKSVLDTVRGLFVIEKGVQGGPIWYVRPQKPRRYCVTTACDPNIGPGKPPCYLLDASRQGLDRIPRERERAHRVAQQFLGRILADPVNETEAWYVDPRNAKRYPVGTPNTDALRVMRSRARQVARKELDSIPIGKGCPKTIVRPPQPPQPKLPGVPYLTALDPVACESLDVRWEAVPDAEAYQIFRDDVSLATVNFNTLTFRDTGLTEQRPYKYKVRSLNAAGASLFSSEEGVQAKPCPPPPPPPQTRKAPDMPISTSIYIGSTCNELVFRWLRVQEADGYDIYRDGQLYATTRGTNTVYTIAMTPRNTQYRFKVRAFNAVGVSAFTTEKLSPPINCGALPPPPSPPPSPPSPLPSPQPLPPPAPLPPQAPPPPPAQGQPPVTPKFTHVTATDCRTFVLHWADVAGEDGYRIYRDGMLMGNVPANDLDFTDTPLMPERLYRYSMRSFNSAGDSAASSEISFKTGTCTTIPAQAAPSQIRINGTSAACAARGGTTCGAGEVCATRWFDVAGDNRCCASACQPLRIANQCNQNSICETFESPQCSDCQCRGGVICGGLCYAGLVEEATCVRDTLVHTPQVAVGKNTVYCADAQSCPTTMACVLPGPCMQWTPSLKLTLDLPSQLEKDVWTQGTATMVVTGPVIQGYRTYVDVQNMDLEATIQGNTVAFPTEWDIAQFQQNVPIVYPIRARMGTVSDRYAGDQLVRGSIGLAFSKGGAPFATKTFVGIERTSAKSCGSYFWNIPGMCLGSVFYPGASCIQGDQCFGRINGWSSYPATYTPKGTYSVLFVTTDLDATQQTTFTQQKFLDIGNEVRAFYLREAERIAGKPMLDFTFTFGGHFQWNLPDTEFTFLNGQKTIRDYLQSKIPNLQLSNYHFIIIGVPRITGGSAVGPAGGWYLGNGVIDLRIPDVLSPMTVAHELGHGFGCRDIWTVNAANSFFICNERRANNLFCSGTRLAPEIMYFDRLAQGMQNLSSLRLDDCGGEFKWGDVDNDGIVDIEDPSVP